jgi:signal transduction histidine kinase
MIRSVRADVVLAAVLTVVTAAALTTSADSVDWQAHLLAALSVAPIALRQRAPLTITLVMCAALMAFVLLGYGDFPDSGVGAVVGLFSVAQLRPWPSTALALGAVLLALVTVYSTVIATFSSWPTLAAAAVQCVTMCLLGESTKRWSQRVERLAEQAATAVADERIRIAHELHDIMAHHMSVISLQSGLAEHVLTSDQEMARKAMATVGGTSREALAEMRRLLTVLRPDGPDGLRPQPGLSELDGLVTRLRETGLRVDLSVTGRRRPLPSGLDLCAYRVAQESLTNVLKHAGPARAAVTLDYGEQVLTLEVVDDGAAPPPRQSTTTPRGIAGMRERAELYGGILDAGPRPEGGFGVLLRLPCEETP